MTRSCPSTARSGRSRRRTQAATAAMPSSCCWSRMSRKCSPTTSR
jgi:hypothetical protein